MTTVKFNPPDDMIEALRDLSERASETVVPLTRIAQLFAEEMRQNIRTRKSNVSGPWDALKATTLRRHDAVLGVDTGQTLGSIGVFVRDHIAGAEATSKGAVFMHTGRSRDWRRGFNRAKRSKRTGRRQALTKKAREAFGERLSGTEMEVREFGWVPDAAQEKAETMLLDHLFVEFAR